MLEDESTENYIHSVIDLSNGIRASDVNLEECDVVHKILLTLAKSYKPQR